jgi:hypothetical protein
MMDILIWDIKREGYLGVVKQTLTNLGDLGLRENNTNVPALEIHKDEGCRQVSCSQRYQRKPLNNFA